MQIPCVRRWANQIANSPRGFYTSLAESILRLNLSGPASDVYRRDDGVWVIEWEGEKRRSRTTLVDVR